MPLLQDQKAVYSYESEGTTVRHRAFWLGVVAEEVCHKPGGREAPPLEHHLVTVHLGKPTTLYQERGGKSLEAVHSDNVSTITPAHQSDKRFWHNECHAVHFWLQHDFLVRMSQEVYGIHAEPLKTTKTTLHSSFLSNDDTLARISMLLLTELRHEATSQGTVETLYVESLRNTLAAHLLRQYGTAPEKETPLVRPLSSTAMNRLEEFIEGHLDQDLTLDCLSQIAAVSPFHLARQFKAATGSTLHQYVVNRRVEVAKRLLAEDQSVTEAAYQVGFGSQSLLTRHFKKLTGTTPAAYARTARLKR